MSTLATPVRLPTHDLDNIRELQKNVSEHPRVPAAIYRHAPISPLWPWMGLEMPSSEVQPALPHAPVDNKEEPDWPGYPGSLFSYWTPDQVSGSKMLINCNNLEACVIRKVDILDGGKFDKSEEGRPVHGTAHPALANAFWDGLRTPRPASIRVRALFVENMSLEVLQMLGTKYNVEPSFFTSSANWVPSRYQEDPKPGEGDHITIVLPFIRTMKDRASIARVRNERSTSFSDTSDTQSPFFLSDDVILLQDLLAIHMVRSATTNTIISYHPHSEPQMASSKRLQYLVQRAGETLYWSKIFANATDPTLYFLVILWYIFSAWDDVFEELYRGFNMLENRVLMASDINHTRQLHSFRAYVLYYEQLLKDFRRSVVFVKSTPNPAMDAESITDQERCSSVDFIAREADKLLSEIDRLEEQNRTQFDQLTNVMGRTFSVHNIGASRSRQVVVATMGHSAAKKQISYLAMVFLPASYIATVFGMNVVEINPNAHESLAHFAEASIALILLTAWLVIALRKDNSLHPEGCHIARRLAWPVFFIYERITRNKI